MGIQSTTAIGDSFESEVAEHYQRLGYVVERGAPVNGQRVDILASFPQPDGQPYKVMIECKYHEQKRAGNDDIQSIVGAYLNAKHKDLVQACTVVTTWGFTFDAKREAAAANIHLLTRAELNRRTERTPSPHAQALSRWYEEQSGNVPIFLHGQGRVHGTTTVINNVADSLHQRAVAAEAGLTLLFAGPGTGKTTQLIKLADRLAREFLAGLSVPLPIYIPLERYIRHREAKFFDHFIVDYLRSQYRMQNISWLDISAWLKQREAMLLLDGFDEIAHVNTEQAVLNEFAHIANVLGPECCAILSCRAALAGGFTEPLATQLSNQLAEERHPAPQVVVLELFRVEDVIVYLDRANASNSLLASSIAQAVLRRPLFLKLAVETMDEMPRHAARIETEADLLERCISRLFKRSDLRRAEDISREQWRLFLEDCALKMMLEEQKTIEPAQLTKLVKEHFRLRDEDVVRLRLAEQDARVRTVLDFDMASEGLRWTHVVFRDYFAAGALALRLLQPQPEDRELDGRWLSSELTDFIRHTVKRMKSQWNALSEFRRPIRRPPLISLENPWQWISPGIGIINDPASPPGSTRARLFFFPRGFWMSTHPLSHGDIEHIDGTWCENDRHVYGASWTLTPNTPLTNITHRDAERLAARLGGRLPTEIEWERGAKWVDGSFPVPEMIPKPQAVSYPPLLAGIPDNPWGIRNAAGCIWQWTATFDTASQRFICRGPWWDDAMPEKVAAVKRLKPREPSHLRTGVRVVVDPETGGDL